MFYKDATCSTPYLATQTFSSTCGVPGYAGSAFGLMLPSGASAFGSSVCNSGALIVTTFQPTCSASMGTAGTASTVYGSPHCSSHMGMASSRISACSATATTLTMYSDTKCSASPDSSSSPLCFYSSSNQITWIQNCAVGTSPAVSHGASLWLVFIALIAAITQIV